MTLSIEPAEPVTVEVAVGCGTSRPLAVHWESGTLYARAGTEAQQAFQPTPEEWKRFWRAADKADVWTWNQLPESDGPAFWHLALDTGAKHVTASGVSVASDAFKTFFRALKKLMPGVGFSLPK